MPQQDFGLKFTSLERWQEEAGWMDRGMLVKRVKGMDSQLQGVVNRCVVTEDNPIRKLWELILLLLLIYTATVMPFKLAFVEMALPAEVYISDGWLWWERLVDLLFWVDLVVNFFFSYRDSLGKEVVDQRRIAKNYLSTYFVLNLIACLPPELVGWLVNSITGSEVFDENNDDSPTNINKSLRVARLERVSRLARLVRMCRMTILVQLMSESPIWQTIQGIRGVRVCNFIVSLMWVVHIVACGWFICASLHSHWEYTWVNRRTAGFDPDDDSEVSVVDLGPFDQWLHAMYFVLTVFTTVGFGDIGPITNAEVVYVMCVMLVGAVVNGIIISEVINIITDEDQLARDVEAQKGLVERFARHTALSQKVLQDMLKYVSTGRAVRQGYNREEMRELIVGQALPRKIINELPDDMFGGLLLANRFVTQSTFTFGVPTPIVPQRFPLLVGLAVNVRYVDHQEIIYHCFDHAWNIFMVLEGMFAHVGKPTPHGGISERIGVVQSAGKSVESESIAAGRMIGHLQSLHAGKKKDDQAKLEAEEKNRELAAIYSPYEIYGPRSYFGDSAVFMKTSRRFTARCESEAGGTLLVISRDDVQELSQEFPLAAQSWRITALRHDRRSRVMLKRLKTRCNIKELAATQVQRIYRYGKRQDEDVLPVLSTSRSRDLVRPGGTAAGSASPPTDVASLRGDVARLDQKLSDVVHTLGLITQRLGIDPSPSGRTGRSPIQMSI